MPTALDVTNYIAGTLGSMGDECDLTPLKLHKLLYYSQGFCLAILGRPLFPEAIEAWEDGPVVRDVYQTYAEDDLRGSYLVQEHRLGNAGSVSEEEREVINDVLETYGQFSAWRLRNMTHEEEPWKSNYVAGTKAPIPLDELQGFFAGRIEVDG